jgi:hypothetical protein
MGDGLLFGGPYQYVDDTVFADEKSPGHERLPGAAEFWLCECASPGELLCTDLLRDLPTGFSTRRKQPF